MVNKALYVTPLFVYDNIEDKKKEIWTDNKDKSGVYRWIYTLTGISYVGSSTILKRTIKYYLAINYLKTYKQTYAYILNYNKVWFKCIQTGNIWALC